MNSQEKQDDQTRPEKKAVRVMIEQTKPEDYDGHTEFAGLTPAQRLAWLDQTILFIASRKQPRPIFQVGEPPSDPFKAK